MARPRFAGDKTLNEYDWDVMKIIGVCGRKGGSGKTTVAIHLAAELSFRGFKVIFIDCDIQGSATYWAEPGNLPMPVQHMALEDENEVSAWSATVRGMDADFIVLDSPPHIDAALGGVIGVSDITILPATPSGLDLIAAAETIGLIRDFRKTNGGEKPKIMLVPNRVDRRTTSGRELRFALRDLGEETAPELRARTAFVDAFNSGDWVGAYAPNSLARKEISVLTNRVAEMLELL